MKSGVTIKDHMRSTLEGLHALLARDVLVGIPAENAERQEPGEKLNNATIGYIQENGAPAANIPARPHLVPGVQAAQPEITERFRKAAIAGLQGEQAEMLRQLGGAGMAAVSSVKRKLDAGIAPALADSTLAARARRGRKGAAQEILNRAAGKPASVELAKPLIDTGEYRSKLTYVVRKK